MKHITRKSRRIPFGAAGTSALPRPLIIGVMCKKETGSSMAFDKEKVIVASDVNPRDGIGVEYYVNEELLVEVFRDDTERTRTVTVFKENVSLEQMERAISLFKQEITWEFTEYEEWKSATTHTQYFSPWPWAIWACS